MIENKPNLDGYETILCGDIMFALYHPTCQKSSNWHVMAIIRRTVNLNRVISQQVQFGQLGQLFQLSQPISHQFS